MEVGQTGSYAIAEPSSVDVVAANLRLLLGPGDTAELRVQSQSGYVRAGFFDGDHIEEMASAAVAESRDGAKGVWFTMNPVKGDLLSRSPYQVGRAKRDALTKDTDISRRKWLLIDTDPKRPADTSSTHEEKAAALAIAKAVRAFLKSEGFPDPVFADSGNGYHQLYRVDLEADDKTKEIVNRLLKVLTRRFESDAATIDTSVSNAARVVKLYGTVSRKGENTADRPHRCSRILEVPSEMIPVSTEMLKALADEATPVAMPPASPRPTTIAGGHGVSLQERLRRGKAYLKTIPTATSGDKGHDKTYRAACELVVDFDIPPEDAYPLMAEWNLGCTPPWGEEDLRRKLDEANKKTDPRGSKLKKPEKAKRKTKEERIEAARIAANEKGIWLDRAPAGILKTLGITALGYCPEEGQTSVLIFSKANREFFTIKDTERLGQSHLGIYVGPDALTLVRADERDEEKIFTTYSMREVKNAVGASCHGKKVSRKSMIGPGVWSVGEVLVLSQGNSVSILEGDQFSALEEPQFRGRVVDSREAVQWEGFETIGGLYRKSADPHWCRDVFRRVVEAFSVFDNVPSREHHAILAAMVGCTWLQDFWPICPHVFIHGDSNTGKSKMSKLIMGLFGGVSRADGEGLPIHLANSTAAGILGDVGKSSAPIILDEIDQWKPEVWSEVMGILLRYGGTGGASSRGRQEGGSRVTRLKACVWQFGQTCPHEKGGDINRCIDIELDFPKEINPALPIPSVAVLRELGLCLLAAGMRHRHRIAELFLELYSLPIGVELDRPKEIRCLPAAFAAVMLAAGRGHDEERRIGESILHAACKVLSDSPPVPKNHDRLVWEILGSRIRHGHEDLTVAQVIEKSLKDSSIKNLRVDSLESHGLRLLPGGKLFIVPERVKGLLVSSKTSSKEFHLGGLDKILLKFPGAEKDRAWCGGIGGRSAPRGVCIPLDAFLEPDEKAREPRATASLPQATPKKAEDEWKLTTSGSRA